MLQNNNKAMESVRKQTLARDIFGYIISICRKNIYNVYTRHLHVVLSYKTAAATIFTIMSHISIATYK